MDRSNSPDASETESLLPAFRALMSCSRQVERVAGRHIESLGLTLPQFDVLTTLGDTAGMTVSDVSERTLITRGTLKPVLDRLEAKGLLKRCKGTKDARQVLVSLTPAGQRMFEDTFMPHVTYMRRFTEKMPPERQAEMMALLREFEQAFS